MTAAKTADDAGHKSRVYIIEQQPFDYSPATMFGEIVFMVPRKLAPDAPGASSDYNREVIHQIRKELADYVPGIDLIAPTGAPVRMLAVGMVLAEKGKTHRALGWDSRTQRYLEYKLVL